MFKIIDSPLSKTEYGEEKYLKNWPMIYILENEKMAYVGESTNVTARMTQHRKNPEKKDFKSVHLIYSDKFNQSATFDYESRLIQLIAADGTFVITNKNDGIANKEYFEKLYYDENFERLWQILRDKKLAKKSITDIVNSDLFKYSPYKELNEEQSGAITDIVNKLNEQYEMENDLSQAIVVNGMPGSGKTIVATYLFKFLRDYQKDGETPYADKTIALVVPQTSLRKTLKKLFKGIYGLKSSDVIGPSDVAKKEYDIVIVDEAHRLHKRKNIPNYGSHDANNRELNLPKDGTELDWILKQAKCVILFYDNMQVVGPSGIEKSTFSEKLAGEFKKRMTTYYKLFTQMRVKGGNDYITYIQSLLQGRLNGPSDKVNFENYEFYLVDSFGDFEKRLYEKEKVEGLSRMVAGYAWPWISKNDKTKKDICIEEYERMWNNRTENWVHSETALDEVGCIHSVQGYDLNYAFVILGKDIKYNPDAKKVYVDKDSYFDKNGKNTTTLDELDEYIKNIYYVLMTRGIKGTYLYICDEELKKYFSEFIETI
ncbi:DUF2075 domain-containing protein [Lachnospiraceae bacterium OttesenSCG-928-J05]|nr:DUF2075 domain-containing protein [Lachnospiraceae bacterium OttesenSCG-928-J05]